MQERQSTVRLREAPGAAPRDTKVIDARFDVIAPKKRGILGKVWIALVAAFWAAVIGFAIPPLWMLAQRMIAFLN